MVNALKIQQIIHVHHKIVNNVIKVIQIIVKLVMMDFNGLITNVINKLAILQLKIV